MSSLNRVLIAALGLSSPLPATEYYWTTLAGNAQQQASSLSATDGTGEKAAFQKLASITVDRNGTLYGSEYYNIRKITPAAVVTTIAGGGYPGYADGLGNEAIFSNPQGIAAGADGNLYVADTDNRVIRKISPEGLVTTFAGNRNYAGFADGTGAAALFAYPRAITVSPSGMIYVADSHTIRMITPSAEVTTVAGLSTQGDYADGMGASARFRDPRGLACDSQGNLYIADTDNHAIRRMTPDGVVTTLAGIDFPNSPGLVDGYGTAARFSSPTSVAVNAEGTVFVADKGNQRIRKVTAGGAVTTLNGPGFEPAPFVAVALDTTGVLYITDGNIVYRTNSVGAAMPFAGGHAPGSITGSTDGLGPLARFYYPNGIGTDSAGNAYVADQANSKLRKVAPNGMVSSPAAPDQGLYPVELQGTDVSGTTPVYVAVRARNQIFAMDVVSGMYSVFAGSIAGIADGTGTAARFRTPADVALGPGGILYVADMGNHTIRKISPGAVVTTLAGAPGQDGTADGIGANARFNQPSGLATDAAGNIFVADHLNYIIRKITPDGIVSTLAGMPGVTGTTDGVGNAARFSRPQGVAVDAQGNVIVADTGQHTIRQVTPAGVVTTIGGLSLQRGLLDGLGSEARFFEPSAVAVAPDGRILITDRSNHRIAVGAPSALNMPDISVSLAYQNQLPDPDSFGTVLIGGAAVQTYVIRNQGRADLTGVSVSIDGDDASQFSVIQAPSSTVPGLGGSTTFQVRFLPTRWAVFSATLHVASNDPDQNLINLDLRGTSLGFTSQPVNQRVVQGSAAAFEAVLGASGLSYQWLKDGVEIPGATSRRLVIGSAGPPGAQPWHIGKYSVRVSNDVSTTMSAEASLELVGVPTGLWRGLSAYYPFEASLDDLSRPNRPALLYHTAALQVDPTRGGVAHIQGKGFAIPPFAGEPADQQGPGGFIQIPRPSLTAGAPFTAALVVKEQGFTLWHGESFITLGERASSVDLLGHYWIGSLDGTDEHYGGNSVAATPYDSEYVLTGSAVTLNEPWNAYILVAEGEVVSLYRNGELKGTMPYKKDTLGDFFIGRHWWDNGASYSTRLVASIDDFRVYNRALTEPEVKALAASMRPDPDPYGTWAMSYGLSGLEAEPSADPDSDTHSNWDEFCFGTQPNQPSPSLLTATFSSPSLTLEWLQRAGVTYQFKTNTDLSPTWENSTLIPALSPNQSSLPPDYKRMRAEVPVPPSVNASPARYFRIEAK